MRRHYLDNIRWLTVFLVVIYHVFMIYSSVIPALGIPFQDVQYQDGVLYILYPWFMTLLFIVSGMSSRYYLEKHSIKEFIQARTQKLLVPSTIGVLVFGWIQGYVSMLISNAFTNIPSGIPVFVLYFIMALSGISVLWFAQILWLLSLLLALIHRFETGKLYAYTENMGILPIVLLGIPLWLSGLVLNTPIITVYRFGIYSFALLLGYFVFAHESVIERIRRYRYAFLACFVALGIWFVAKHFGENYAAMPLMGSISATAYAWVTILAAFGIAKASADKTNALCEFMKKKSWGIYVFHYLPLSATAYCLRTYTSLPEIPCYLIAFIASMAGSLALYEIISRIPVLRWCILGIKEKKHV